MRRYSYGIAGAVVFALVLAGAIVGVIALTGHGNDSQPSSGAPAEETRPARGNVQIEHLADGAAILLVDGEVSLVDLREGDVRLLAEADRVAADRRSNSLLLVQREENRSRVKLMRIDGEDAHPLAEEVFGLHVIDLMSAGWGSAHFCLVARPAVDRDATAPWIYRLVRWQQLDDSIELLPVPGLSQVAGVVGMGRLGFSEPSPGTFAYSATVSDPRIALGETLENPEEWAVPDDVGGSFLIVVIDGLPKFAWEVISPASSGHLGFSDDGHQLLVRLQPFPPVMDQNPFQIIDLETGELAPAAFFPSSAEVVAVNGTLDAALGLVWATSRAAAEERVRRAEPNADLEEMMAEVDARLEALAAEPEAESQVNAHEEARPHLYLFQADANPTHLLVFDETARVAGSWAGEEAIVTDGASIWTVDAESGLPAEIQLSRQ